MIKYSHNQLTFSEVDFTDSDSLLNHYHLSKKNRYLYYQNGLIKINDQVIKQNHILNHHDIITIEMINEEEYIPFDKQAINIVYEDDLLLVVDKPSFLLVHSDGNTTHTLSNQVAYYYHQQGYNIPVRAIHRLDYETSGMVVFCKIGFFQAYLDYLLSEKLIERQYEAICVGKLKTKQFIIDKPIGRDRHNSKKMRISDSGKEAKTSIHVKKVYHGYTHISCKLYTGRTHQIRVHTSSINHPLVSDPLYGKKDARMPHLALHASKLIIYHPLYDKKLVLECKLNKDMATFLKNL